MIDQTGLFDQEAGVGKEDIVSESIEDSAMNWGKELGTFINDSV